MNGVANSQPLPPLNVAPVETLIRQHGKPIRGRSHPEELRRQALAAYVQSSENTSHIAANFGVSPSTLTVWARHAGIPLRERGRKKAEVPSKDALRRLELRASGFTLEEVGTATHVTKQRVSRIAKRWPRVLAELKRNFTDLHSNENEKDNQMKNKSSNTPTPARRPEADQAQSVLREVPIADGPISNAPVGGSPTLVSIVPSATSSTQGQTEKGQAELVTDAMPAYWVERINRLFEKLASGLIETGQALLAAKAKLKHGHWLEMFKTKQFKFDLTLAQRLMKAASNPALTNTANLPFLPPSPTALVALSNLPPEVVQAGINEGHICPGMTIAAAGKFVRDRLAEPGEKGADDTSARLPNGASVRNEFVAVLWDDSDAPPARAPEKSYGAKTYPNLAFFRYHSTGDTKIDTGSKHGLTDTALFVVPVEQGVIVKDGHGRAICKATCRYLALSLRGVVPATATVPNQIIEGGFAGVTKMIDSMFPGTLKVLSSAEHEAPLGWAYVPRQSGADGEAKDSSVVSNSSIRP